MDIVEQEFTLGWAQLFAVFYLVEPGCLYATGQDDGGSYHRSSQGTPPDFINASDKLIALCYQQFFLSKGWFLTIIYQPYPL